MAEHGPEALSNAVIMDGICQAQLGNLPGEATLIGSAARTDVPALLRDLIPRLGNYGAIQSVAATLADAHGLDTAACVWVVREFARALGLIASGGTHPRPALALVAASVRAQRLRPSQPGRPPPPSRPPGAEARVPGAAALVGTARLGCRGTRGSSWRAGGCGRTAAAAAVIRVAGADRNTMVSPRRSRWWPGISGSRRRRT